jgi:hypothetical protein
MLLNFYQAKETILQHAGHIVLDERPSLIRSLRPYSGLREDDFKEVFIALVSVHEELSSRECLDRELVYACWDLCCRINILALRDKSLLRMNKLIEDRDLARLDDWHHSIEAFCRRSLHKLDLGTCMINFIEYIGSTTCPDPSFYREFLSLFHSLAPRADFELAPIIQRTLAAIEGK